MDADEATPTTNQAEKSQEDTSGQDTTHGHGEGEAEPQSFDRDYVEKLRKENAKYRTRVKELEPAATKLKEIEDASKSELEKAQERIKALEAESSVAQAKVLRSEVANAKGIPVYLLPASGSKEELEEAADKLIEWAAQEHKRPGLPKVDAVGKDTSGMSRDELAREILGIASN